MTTTLHKSWSKMLILAVALVFLLAGCNTGGTETPGQGAQENQSGAEQGGESAEQSEESETSGGSEQSGEDGNEAASKPVELEFYYPVSVGGALSEKIESYVNEFNELHEGEIKVEAVFSGNYTETLTKVKTAVEGGNAPDVAILLQTDIFDLTDLGYVEPLDAYIEEAGDAYIEDFYPALLAGSEMDGKRYSLPFQRSTQILYYNKDVFAEAGVDRAPDTWDELVEFGKKLVKKDNGEVTRWALQVPMGGPFSYWNMQPFILQNGVEMANPEGTEVRFDDPKTIEAIGFFQDLAKVHGIMPEGPQGWGDVPTNFLSGKTAMMVHSTGSLTNIKNQAEFDFGVAMLPTNGGKRTNLGGGNLYILKDIPQENKDAAWEFVKFLTTPEKAADWSIASGYIATRKSAYEVPALKSYVEEFPQAAVARDQLEYAGAEFATHNFGKVTKAFGDEIDAILTASKTVEQAMKDAQAKAERELRGF